MVGDKIAFKSMYGFLTGSPEGIGAHTRRGIPTIRLSRLNRYN